MHTKTLLLLLIAQIYFMQVRAQSIGVNLPPSNPLPTANLDINGTLHVTELVKNLTDFNYVGSAIPTRFDADRTILVDSNGYIGYQDGLPIVLDEGISPIKYTRDSAVLDNNGYINSITTIDSQFYVRITNLVGSVRTGTYAKYVEIAFKSPTFYGAFMHSEGDKRPPIGKRNPIDWTYEDSNANIYGSIEGCTDPRDPACNWVRFPTNISPQPDQRDVVSGYIIDYSRQVIYRVAILTHRPGRNTSVNTEGSIFIEELK